MLQKDYDSVWINHNNTFGIPSSEMIASLGTDFIGKSIIDIGSGDGRYALAFEKMNMKVTALEISKLGSELISKRSLCTVEIINEDFNLWNPNSRQFDFVFSSGLLEEFETFEEQKKAIKKMISITKIGGKICLRLCTFISNRIPERRANAEDIHNLFMVPGIKILSEYSDKAPFYNQKSSIQDNQNTIQRHTIIAIKA